MPSHLSGWRLPVDTWRRPSLRGAAPWTADAVTPGAPPRGEPVEGRQRPFDDLARQLSHDEDEPRAVVRRRPAVQVHRRMNQVLDAVDHHWRRHADHLEDSLHP